ncbi:flagellar protein FliT [Pseudomonas sp.]|uniref:flagellar protein FliT n=1 Tax=Pseudomonas sp. TaxID=306 RepID=UPI00272CE8D7|nr:flagellar protein FliT [Pseudomonas sp.]
MMSAVPQLEQVHSSLVEAVKAGDWEQVGELDLLCRQLVGSIMQQPGRDDEQLSIVLTALSETYREVIALCQAVQGQLALEMQTLQRSKQSAKVYQMFT